METICNSLNLLRNDKGVIRIPFLVKGKVIAPPEMGREQIEAAFRDAGKETLYLKLPEAQLVREPVIDRKTLQYSGEYIYQVLPPVSGSELIETDIDKLVQGPYALSAAGILDYLDSISAVLGRNRGLLTELLSSYRLTAGYPEAFLDAWFEAISSTLDRKEAGAMIDNELSLWGKPGSEFLNGWVEVPSGDLPGTTFKLAQSIFNKEDAGKSVPPLLIRACPWLEQGGIKGDFSTPQKTFLRAMPTRQLHITAGNAPEVPVISALRAILTKSAAVIKLPFGATLTGSLFALAAAAAEPDHPLTQNLSVVYWQGGDSDIENILFRPHAFDRVVVWGSPETVAAVQSRALYTRTICLNPRYGVSLIGQEAFHGSLEEAVLKASVDSLIYDQKACTASLVHYVEGTEEQANQYAECLQQAFGRWDSSAPGFIPPATRGELKRLKRGRYNSARWYLNSRDGEFTSGAAVMPDEFDVLDHPLCRLVVVRPVKKLEAALKYLHPGVSAAGVYPEERREALRDRILARGVSSVFPLGHCERLFAGMPHDGMPVLSHLVDWKNA